MKPYLPGHGSLLRRAACFIPDAKTCSWCLLIITGWLMTLNMSVAVANISPDLEEAMSAGNDVRFIVYFDDHVALDTSPTAGEVKPENLIDALVMQAKVSQAGALKMLQQEGADQLIQIWSINALAATASPRVVRAIANLPGVRSIKPDTVITLPSPDPLARPRAPARPGWNLTLIRAPELWQLGLDGTGTVVAGMDSGVDLHHPDLMLSWRGGNNSWFDPNGEYATPVDKSGHGTQTMSLIAGGDASGINTGVAPGAQWIAVKIFNDAGVATLSGIHQGFQWLLDPDGNPETDDAPDVVNNSWNFPGLVGQCFREFEADIRALRAAGIAVVFSGGNQGTLGSTSPGNYPDSFAVGAVDAQSRIVPASGRGPSDCDGSFFPEVVAPGVDIRAANLTLGGTFPDTYTSVSGSSFAAPQVAGAIALLRQSNPAASVRQLELALINSAVDLGASGPDHVTGYGRIDVMAANTLISGVADSAPPVITLLGTNPVELTVGDKYIDAGATAFDAIDGDLGTLTGVGNVDTSKAGSYTVTYTALDGAGNAASLIRTVNVIRTVKNEPVSVNDMTTVKRNSSAVFIDLIKNDFAENNNLKDKFGNVNASRIKITSGFITKQGGIVITRQNGVFYIPKRGFHGTDRFHYTVTDLHGNKSRKARVSVRVVK